MDPVQVAFVVVRMDATLVCLLQIVTDVEEFGRFEVLAKEAFLGIARSETSEPVISHNDRGYEAATAAVLEAAFVEDGELEHNMARAISAVGTREHVAVVKEDNLDATDDCFMHGKLNALSVNVDGDVVDVHDAGGIVREVASLTLAVTLVVRRDDGDLLAELYETDGKLVDHDTEAADGAPAS